MYRTCILNEWQVEDFNQIYNTNLTSIMIQQKGSEYYAILDCDIKIELHEKEIMKYLYD